MNNEDKKLEAIAEQWVNLVFAQMGINKIDQPKILNWDKAKAKKRSLNESISYSQKGKHN